MTPMSQEKVTRLVKKADALLEEHRALTSRPPPPMTSRNSDPYRSHTGTDRFVAEMVTRIASIPPAPAATPEPAEDSQTEDPQAEVVTRIVSMPEARLFENEPTVVVPSPIAAPSRAEPQSQDTRSPRIAPPSPDATSPQIDTLSPDTAPPASEPADPSSTSIAPSLSDASGGPVSMLAGSPVAAQISNLGVRPAIPRLTRTKWIVGGSIVAAAVVTGLVVSLGGAPSSAEETAPSVARADKTKSPPSHPAEPVSREAAAPPAARGTPESDTVLIHLEETPRWSRVRVDGVLSSVPLRLPKSSETVTVIVTAKGYERWRRRIVPDRERHLTVLMTPKRKAKKP